MFKFKNSVSPVIAVILLLAITVVISMSMYSFLEDYTNSSISILSSNDLNGNIEIKHVFADNLFLQSKSDVNISLLRISDSSGDELCSFSPKKEFNSNGLVGHWKFDNLLNNGTHHYVEDLSNSGNNGIIKEGIRDLQITSVNGLNITLNFISGAHSEVRNLGYGNCVLIQLGNSFEIIDDIKITGGTIRNLTLNQSGISVGLVDLQCFNPEKISNLQNGLRFDGLDDFVLINGTQNLNINSSYTILSTIQLENLDFYGNIDQKIFSKHNNTNVGGYKLGIHDITSKKIELEVEIRNSTGEVNITRGFENNKKLLFENNNYFVVGEYDFENSFLRTYINNFNVKNVETSINISSTNIIPTIGVSGTQRSQFFKGYIKEVMIFNRTLSELELEILYSNSIQNQQEGINQIDVSSCNLQENKQYNILMIVNGEKVESTQFVN